MSACSHALRGALFVCLLSAVACSGSAVVNGPGSDTQPPTITTFSLPATSSSTTVAVTLVATDDVGVTGYFVSESGTLPATPEWAPVAPATFTLSGTGQRTLYAWALDLAGNVSARAAASTTITPPDTTAPTITAFSIPATSTSLSVAVTLTATDDVGVAGWFLSANGTLPASPEWLTSVPATFRFSTGGAHTLYAWVRDAAGNVSTRSSATTSITQSDTTAPTISSFSIPASGTSLTVSVTLSASDNVAVTGWFLSETGTLPTSPQWLTSAPTSFTFGGGGARTLYAWVTDAAGNVSARASASTTLTLPDTTPPAITAFSLPATSSSLTVAVTLTASDDVGVTGYFVSETGTLPGTPVWGASAPATHTFATAGTRTLYAWARDAAGNVSARSVATTTITLPDTTAPSITTFSLPSSATSLTVSVTLTATDNVGVTGYYLSETSTLPASPSWSASKPASYTFGSQGTKTLYAWVKDAAGNVSARASATTSITVSSTSGSQWVMGYYVGYQLDMYPLASIDWTAITHLAFGALTIRADHTFDTTFFNFTSDSAGIAYAQQVSAAAHANGVKAILMMGGAGLSDQFAVELGTTDTTATAFANRLIALMNTIGFDGLDLDIEADNFQLDQKILLAKALRGAKSDIILTYPGSAVQLGETVDPKVATLASYLDRYFTQTYQGGTVGLFTGTDGGSVTFKSWFYTALSGATQQTPYAIDYSLNALAGMGIPKSKLGLGIGFYAGCYKIPDTTPSGGADVSAPNMNTGSSSPWCWDCGIGGGDNNYPLSVFFDANSTYAKSAASSRKRDATAQVPYLSLPSAVTDPNCGKARYFMYEDETSIIAKGTFSKSNGYGGVIVWTLAQGWLTTTATEGRARNSLMQALRQGFLAP